MHHYSVQTNTNVPPAGQRPEWPAATVQPPVAVADFHRVSRASATTPLRPHVDQQPSGFDDIRMQGKLELGRPGL